MDAITLRAHFDGKQILLDEPFALEPNAKLIVTVLPGVVDEEREDWSRLALNNLAQAYGPDEPDYSFGDIKHLNPEYERR